MRKIQGLPVVNQPVDGRAEVQTQDSLGCGLLLSILKQPSLPGPWSKVTGVKALLRETPLWGSDSYPRVWGQPNTWSPALTGWDQQQFIGSQLEGERHTPHRTTWGCTWGQSEQPRVVGGRVSSVKRAGCSLVPIWGCDWLVEIIPRASRELKGVTQR